MGFNSGFKGLNMPIQFAERAYYIILLLKMTYKYNVR